MRLDEVLLPDMISAFQKNLLERILGEKPLPQITRNGDQFTFDFVPPDALSQAIFAKWMKQAAAPSNLVVQQDSCRNRLFLSTTILSAVAVHMLDLWDAYLRDKLFNLGVQSDSSALSEDPAVAYEAGRNLANLSWGISISCQPLEQKARSLGLDQLEAYKKSIEQ